MTSIALSIANWIAFCYSADLYTNDGEAYHLAVAALSGVAAVVSLICGLDEVTS